MHGSSNKRLYRPRFRSLDFRRTCAHQLGRVQLPPRRKYLSLKFIVLDTLKDAHSLYSLIKEWLESSPLLSSPWLY